MWRTYTRHIQNSCWLKIWMGFVGQILIKLWTSSIWGFLWLPVWWPLGSYLCKHAGDYSVTTEACSSPHLTCLGLCGMAAWKLNGVICAVECITPLKLKIIAFNWNMIQNLSLNHISGEVRYNVFNTPGDFTPLPKFDGGGNIHRWWKCKSREITMQR